MGITAGGGDATTARHTDALRPLGATSPHEGDGAYFATKLPPSIRGGARSPSRSDSGCFMDGRAGRIPVSITLPTRK